MAGSWIALFVMLWLVVLGLTVLVLGLSRRVQQLTALIGEAEPVSVNTGFPGGPAIGSVFPPLLGASADAGRAAQATAGDGLIVIFMDAECGPCRRLGESLAARDLTEPLHPAFELALVTDEAGRTAYAGINADRIIVQHDREISRRLAIRGTPFCVVVDDTGVVRSSGIPNSLADVTGLVRRATADESEQSPAAIGRA